MNVEQSGTIYIRIVTGGRDMRVCNDGDDESDCSEQARQKEVDVDRKR